MTQPTAEDVDPPAEESPGDHGAHPTDALYVKVALILAVVTLVEVGLYYTKFSQTATNMALIALAAIKFVMVAAYFMHLKFDNKLLRRLFVTGFVLAASVYVAYLMTLGVFV
ncbi:MAG: cytochrome C oxidase subunit IV family protein [Actinomycetota bacterium]|nr:cytochrome C oxidase subunit IV family protein [Actinomycetota bacterium]